MSYFIVKYIGERESGALVYDALDHEDRTVKTGEIFIANENEVENYRNIPDLFEIVQSLDVRSLLKNAMKSTLKPYAHPFTPASRGKVLFLFDSEGGKYLGQRIWEFQMAMMMADAGFSVHILTDEIPPYAKDWPGADKVSWEKAERTGYIGFDYVVGTPPQNLEPAVKYGRENSIPIIIICGELMSSIPGRPESSETLEHFDKLCLSADKIIVPSVTTKESFVLKGMDSKRVFVIGPTLNPNLLMSNVKEKRNEVVLCSRLDAHKDVRETISTLMAHPTKFDITCISTNAESLSKEFGEGNKKHNLSFLSGISEREKAQIFSRSKVLVHPSTWEGYGIAVLEALALATQVIARPLTAFKEIYGDDITYFRETKGLFAAISNAFEKPVNGIALAEKYRSIAGKDRPKTMEKLFEKPRVEISLDRALVAIIGQSDKFGGGDPTRFAQANALKSAGFNIKIGCMSGKSFPYKGFESTILTSENDVYEWLEKERPGVVIADTNESYRVVAPANKLGIPVILFMHFWTPFFKQTKNILSAKPGDPIREESIHLLNKISGILLNSKYTHDVVKKHFGVEGQVVCPEIDRESLKVKGKFNRENIMTPIMENEPDGLRLYEKILKALPNRRFLILYWRGTDKTKKRLQSTYKNLTILNGVDNMGRHYRSAKIFLYTLQVDHTFGMSFAESMIAGTPVIAPKLGNVPNLVKKGGVLLKSIDAEDWIAEIEKCYIEEDHYEKLRKGTKSDAKNIPSPDYAPLINSVEAAIAKSKGVSFHPGHFLASRHQFQAYARIIDGAKVDAPNSENTIAFGPPTSWAELISPRTYCFWASTPLQSGIDRELKWLEETVGYVKSGRLAGIISSSHETVKLAKTMGCSKAYYMRVPAPKLYPLKKVKRHQNFVSLLVGGTHRKNPINQIIAVSQLDPNITVHMTDSIATKIPALLLSSVATVKHDFMEDSKFFELIASCSAGLQVTIGESFNQAAFQHLALGTPCLISNSCPFSSSLPKKFQYLIVNNIEDVDEIQSKLKKAMRDKRHDELSAWARSFAESWNSGVKQDFVKIFS